MVTLLFHVFRILFFRILFKGVELFCRLTTWFSLAGKKAKDDRTLLLLELQTLAQTNALEELRTKAVWTDLKRLLVIVPYRDCWEMTGRCVETLRTQILDGSFQVHIVLVDNGSIDEASFGGLKKALALPWPQHFTVSSLHDNSPFNFSRLNNWAVVMSQSFVPDALLFLNNDVELNDPQTLTKLMGFARCCPKIGALGSTLLYPNGTIQHLFAAPGIKLVAAHPLRGAPYSSAQAWFQGPHPVGAVTGALMLVKAADFAAVNGFDESLPTLGQDIDLCLKLQKKGLCNWVLPQLLATHHESISRGLRLNNDTDKAQITLIHKRWGTDLTHNPYFTSSLSRWSEYPAISLGEGPYPYQLVL